jgi:UDP-glucose 4-epimerase
MSTQVFVVGASGYIGGGVAKSFRRAGYKVYGLVRDEKRAKELLKAEIIPVIGDQSNVESFSKILESSSIIVDAVGFHDGAEKFFAIVKTIAQKKHYKPLFIFTSGIMTYGLASQGPVDEFTEPKPFDPLMERRKLYERQVIQTTDLRTVVVRPGFVYGGNGGPIADMFFGIKPNEPLVLHGAKNKRWSWVHVDDLGDSYVLIAKRGSVVDSQIFNIAAPENPTYEELRIAMAAVAGWKPENKIVEQTPPDGIKGWEATVIINPRKAVDLLGWAPDHVGFLAEVETYYQSWKLSKE